MLSILIRLWRVFTGGTSPPRALPLVLWRISGEWLSKIESPSSSWCATFAKRARWVNMRSQGFSCPIRWKSTPNTSIYWIIASVDWNQAVFDITYEFCCGCENMELTWISFSTVEMGHVPCETWPIHGHIHGHICRKSWFLSCIQRQAILVLLSEEVKSFDDSCVVKGMPSFGIKNPEWEFYLQMKCERYWPYDDEVKQYGDITINLVRM